MNDPLFPLRALGWNDRWSALFADIEPLDQRLVPGRVIRRDRGRILVATGNTLLEVDVTSADGDVATGDWVALSANRLFTVLHRSGALRRRDPSGVEQTLAANVDVVLLVCGLDRPVRMGRIHRGIVQAWDADAEPVVVLTKADLCADPPGAAAAVEREVLGVDVVTVSARQGTGMEQFRRAIDRRTAVLLGESGAGKSSLINALAGKELIKEGRVRSGDLKGRHTTTRRELHLLPDAGVLIDTPGIRSFGLAADDQAIETAFEDIEGLAAGCRFADCRHVSEPGCAVKAAIASGELSQSRFVSYLKLRREVEGQVLRARPHERKRAERRQARLVQEGQDAKQGRLKAQAP